MKQKIFLFIVGLLALFVLLLPVLAARMVLRRLRKKKPAVVTVATPKELPAAAGGSPEASKAAGGDQGDLGNQLQAKIAEQAVQKEKQALEAMNALKLPQVTTKKTEVLARHISTEAKKDPAGMAQIVRTWLNETER
jgi:flagellar biosynthesis/type III secretory pathway M-ring protein FliF/YscJ